MADAETRAREKGCPRLALDVEAENRDAIRLYEHFGFARETRDLRLTVPVPALQKTVSGA